MEAAVMEIKRDLYLKKIISYMWDGQVKVITGIRRCGKFYLLTTIFKNYLLKSGVSEDNILFYALDLAKDIRYRNPLELAGTVRNIVEGNRSNSICLSMRSRCPTRCRIRIIRAESQSLFMMR